MFRKTLSAPFSVSFFIRTQSILWQTAYIAFRGTLVNHFRCQSVSEGYTVCYERYLTVCYVMDPFALTHTYMLCYKSIFTPAHTYSNAVTTDPKAHLILPHRCHPCFLVRD